MNPIYSQAILIQLGFKLFVFNPNRIQNTSIYLKHFKIITLSLNSKLSFNLSPTWPINGAIDMSLARDMSSFNCHVIIRATSSYMSRHQISDIYQYIYQIEALFELILTVLIFLPVRQSRDRMDPNEQIFYGISFSRYL